MRWSVSLVADGDRVVTHDEIVELADAVAASNGIASGIGTASYGAEVVVEAPTMDEAVEAGGDHLPSGGRSGRSAVVAGHRGPRPSGQTTWTSTTSTSTRGRDGR